MLSSWLREARLELPTGTHWSFDSGGVRKFLHFQADGADSSQAAARPE